MIVSIRRAEPADSVRLSAIARAAKAFWGYPQEWLERWKPDLTIDADYVSSNGVFVAECGGAIGGFYALSGSGGRRTLEHLWVDPPSMGRGIGTQLFRHARHTARSLGSHELYLESDPHAADFYRRMGARDVGSSDASIDGVTRTLPQFLVTLPEEDPS